MSHKILMVDDEPDLQVLVKQKFRKRIRSGDLEFLFAENGLEALKSIEANPDLHVIFSDINMPQMDGLTLLKTIRSRFAENNLKVIIVSAYGDMDNIRKAMNLGAFDFITKPIDFADLENTLEKATSEAEILSEALEKVEVAEQEKEEALASKKFKEQFLANMSHEIRTPMNAILGFTNLLLKTELQDEQEKYLKSIKISGNNLLAIINDILDLSKIEAGKMTFEIIPTNLNEVLESIYETMQMVAQKKGLNFRLEKDPALPSWVMGDRVRLSQILINLIGNAIKFTESGEVRLEVKPLAEKDLLHFQVKDTGIGISQEKLSSIFESFSQAAGDTTRKFGGTGLGLTISKELVENQGGVLEVESELGKGSNFHFKIPMPATSPQNQEDEDQGAIQLENLTIILAEDNEFNQIVAVDTLQDLIEGVKVEIAENGQIVLDLLSDNGKTFDLILMDIQMPEMDGHQATQTIRSSTDEKFKNIPIMAMTAHATQEEIQKCFDEGMNDYITKPFDPENLLKKIAGLVKKKS